MATIHNSDLSKELQQGAKIQINRDVIPNQLAEKVVPVMEVNPKLLRRIDIHKAGTLTNGTSATIYTTPADKDFFLVALQLSIIKDGNSTSTSTAINGTVNGVSAKIISIAGITITASAGSTSLTLPIPMKIDRNSNITLTHTTNVANIRGDGIIFGYTVED